MGEKLYKHDKSGVCCIQDKRSSLPYFGVENIIVDVYSNILSDGAFKMYVLLLRMLRDSSTTYYRRGFAHLAKIFRVDWKTMRKRFTELEEYGLVEVVVPSQNERRKGISSSISVLDVPRKVSKKKLPEGYTPVVEWLHAIPDSHVGEIPGVHMEKRTGVHMVEIPDYNEELHDNENTLYDRADRASHPGSSREDRKIRANYFNKKKLSPEELEDAVKGSSKEDTRPIKKKRTELPDDFDDYNSKHWCAYFAKVLLERADYKVIPGGVKDQAQIKRALEESEITPDEFALGMVWFAENYMDHPRLKWIKDPSVGAFLRSWSVIAAEGKQAEIKKKKPKRKIQTF